MFVNIKRRRGFPVHLMLLTPREMIHINRLVDSLGFEDCRAIFEKIRFENRERALYLMKAYVDKKGKS